MTRFKNALAFIRIFRFGDEWKNFLIKPNSMETSCSSERMKSACNFGFLALRLLSLFLARSFSALFLRRLHQMDQFDCMFSFRMCNEVDVTARH